MSLVNLENLTKTNKLKSEPFNKEEFEGLLESGRKRLRDAENFSLSNESKFDLAYNAAHALSLAALRWHGYRPKDRYIVFQLLPQTLNLGSDIWRVLAKCHDLRNLAEYEGYFEADEQLLIDLLASSKMVLEKIEQLRAENA